MSRRAPTSICSLVDLPTTWACAVHLELHQAFDEGLTTIANEQPDHLSMSTTSTMNIALPEPMRAYVAMRAESGQFGNTSEYVCELIRRDQREQDIARLRAMVEVGLASGPARADTAEDWAELEAIARGTKA